MKAVPGYSHLVRRGAVYWLRRRVPNDLAAHLPFTEWKETLGTKDLKEAKRLLRLRLVKIDNEIAIARAKVAGAVQPPLTRQEAAQIAASRLAEWLNDDEEARLENGEAAFDNVEAWLEAEGENPSRALAAGRWQEAERNAEWALEQFGRWYPKGDPSVRLLANEILKARVQFTDMVIQRQGGEVVTAPATAIALEPSRPSSAATGITLGALIAQYRAAREVEHGAESTSRKYGHIFKALEEVLGADRLVATVTKEDARAVRNPGVGGWAFTKTLGEKTIRRSGRVLGETTNNQMEMVAVLQAVRSLTRTDIPAVVFTDSEYVVKGLTEWLPRWIANGWRGSNKKPVANRELWEALKAAVDGHTAGVTMRWVRGHNGDPGNGTVDAMANAEAGRASTPMGIRPNIQTTFDPGLGLILCNTQHCKPRGW